MDKLDKIMINNATALLEELQANKISGTGEKWDF